MRMSADPILSMTVGARTTELPRARAIAREALRRQGCTEQHVIDVSIVLSELLLTAAEEGQGDGTLELRLLVGDDATRVELQDHLMAIVALGGRHHALRSDVLAALTSAQGSFSSADGSTLVWAE